MDKKTELKMVSEETMRFMRKNYTLDEVPGKYYEADCLKFRQGKKTILSINIHETHYDFQIIYGKAEREKFEARRNEFPKKIRDLYDSQRTLHDGKWMLIRVDDLETLEVVKKLILIKKKPNRKPLFKEQAVHADCGSRCDLCVHYTGKTVSEELREDLRERLNRIYGELEYWNEKMIYCDGCTSDNCTCSTTDSPCKRRSCMAEKDVERCKDCAEYPCYMGLNHYFYGIHHTYISAEDVNKAILPYTPGQYED